jgi:hypothetical protein
LGLQQNARPTSGWPISDPSHSPFEYCVLVIRGWPLKRNQTRIQGKFLSFDANGLRLTPV